MNGQDGQSVFKRWLRSEVMIEDAGLRINRNRDAFTEVDLFRVGGVLKHLLVVMIWYKDTQA